MSNYCKDCHYDVKQKDSDRACPFYSLCWRFIQQHREQLTANPRIGMVYHHWDKLDKSRREAILGRAEAYLAGIDQL